MTTVGKPEDKRPLGRPRRRWEDNIDPLKPNDPYMGRTAPLAYKHCILYIYSTNIGTEYFKHGIYSPFFPLQNAACFIIVTYLVPVLLTFYIQDVLKLKKKSGAKRLRWIFRKWNVGVWTGSSWLRIGTDGGHL